MAKTAPRDRAATGALPPGLVPIPRIPGKPVLGNMLDIDAEHPIRSIMALSKRLGPIFQLDMMGRNLTIVWGHELVDELCDEKRFDKSVRGALQRIRSDGGGGDGLFTAYTSEPNWHKAHNILLPNFSDKAMLAYHPSMLDIASQMMLKWERMNPDDEIDVTRDMTALTLDTIGLCGFGYRFNSFYREGNHPFVEAMVQSLEGAMKLRGVPFEDLGGAKMKQLKAHTKYMETIADGLIAERKREHAANPDRKLADLLDYMLAGVDKKSGERLDSVNIRRQLLTFLIAGHETTSGLLSFCVYFLMNNPDVARRASEEVDRVFGSDSSVLPTVKQVNQLTYVAQILKETLRLWPTAPAFAVYPYKDEVLGGKYFLKKNSHTMLMLPMLHRDPAVWGPRADAFDPDQFSPEAEAARPVNAYKPFGNGQRACIGMQFAIQEATLVIGMLLQRFTLVDHTRYQLEIRESLTVKPDGLKIKVRKRLHAGGGAPSNGHAGASPSGNGAAAAPAGSAPATLEPPLVAVPSHGTPLLVLYGSNLGSAEDIARHIAENGAARGFEVSIGALDDYVGRLPKNGAVAIVTASYNGAPPDNATAFYTWLSEGLAPDALAGVKYSVFGAGNRNWASTYQAVPRTIDEKLAEFGAERFYERGEGDARDDLDAHFQAWKGDFWPTVSRAFDIEYKEVAGLPERPMYEIEFVPGPDPNPLAAAHGATGMRVLVNRELQSGGERSTRHIEVALAPGSTYRTGDHLGVLPSNSPALVERVLERFGFDALTYVRLHSSGPGRIASLPLQATLSVRRLLMHYVELQGVATRKQIATLAEHTRCPVSKPALLELASEEGDDYRDEIKAKRTSILDLLERYPACELSLPQYLEMLPLMTPRYYSISSSPVAEPDRMSITVGVVREPAYSGNGIYEGIASTHLARREAGTRLFAFIKSSKSGFTLPEDPSRPIIMVGPGTGLAPFRGFLAERAELGAQGKTLGPAMLFFGCRHPEQDFIYRHELQAYAEAGIVDLNVAFSRLGETKTYVQDLIEKKSDAVWSLLESGATVYVCGDGSQMEPQVRARFETLYREKTGADAAAASAWLVDLVEKRRYVLDVWAST
jgi:cytochrome P450/NADPH-cytochrome P450 reductase